MLGQRCVQGMKVLLPEPRSVSLREGTEQLALPALAGAGCVRAVVVGEGSVSGELLEGGGARLASDRGPGFALVDPGGPVCVRAGQVLTLRVQAQGEAVRVQVWAAP